MSIKVTQTVARFRFKTIQPKQNYPYKI